MKCIKCRYFNENKIVGALWWKHKMDIPYCEKLRHFLENGYAMKSHSEVCGEK